MCTGPQEREPLSPPPTPPPPSFPLPFASAITRSSGADASADWTVALGSQLRATNTFSRVVRWEHDTDRNVAGTRAADPAAMMARERGTRDGLILANST